MIKVSIVVLITLVSLIFPQQTLYVDAEAPGETQTGQSPEEAFLTIAQGIEQAGIGDYDGGSCEY